MTVHAEVREPDLAHLRPAVAKWRGALSLRARLSLIVAFVLAAAIIALSYLEVHAIARTIERELENTAQLAAVAVADELASRPGVPDDAELADWLHDFIEANSA